MTRVIEGRPRYGDSASPVITLTRAGYNEPEFELRGALIENRSRDGEFHIGVKHPSAVDSDHDSAYLAYFEGAGLTPPNIMWPTQIGFNCVLLSVKYYTDDPEPKDAGECTYESCKDDPHGYLSFTPPEQKFKPGVFEVRVDFAPKEVEE